MPRRDRFREPFAEMTEGCGKRRRLREADPELLGEQCHEFGGGHRREGHVDRSGRKLQRASLRATRVLPEPGGPKSMAGP